MEETRRVVVLEPRRLLRELVARTLREAGLEVAEATSAQELFAHLDASPFDAAVVLLDPSSEFPGLDPDARQLLCELKGFWFHVHVVVLLTRGGDALGAEARSLGAVAALRMQDLGATELLQAVEAAARGEQQLQDGGLGQLRAQEAQQRAEGMRRPELTPREWQVLRCVSAGMDNLKVAAHLGISELTVKSHMTALYRKLGVENRTELALKGRALGLQAVA
ncbi:response regulator transcription factor [Aggregicoccus sp. 17bor-14]|uniref:LuxR family transcriptional regulator n=1 Tax=Myxococcaceae TaxID=31 RepID=UPI00129CB6FD|nr:MULTISPECIES: response regulator transcription factor [Myxococcaceae]MBF5046394.1 response regulator transcription factor [Simulacricoccus sp. 17bor-14]MRI92114.1 response regulator transcription factor [Aggregicoccus sp. 17bor-14]